MCRTADVGIALLHDVFASGLPVSLPFSLQISLQMGSRSVHVAGFNLAVQIDFDTLSCSALFTVASCHSSASSCEHCLCCFDHVQAEVNAYLMLLLACRCAVL